MKWRCLASLMLITVFVWRCASAPDAALRVCDLSATALVCISVFHVNSHSHNTPLLDTYTHAHTLTGAVIWDPWLSSIALASHLTLSCAPLASGALLVCVCACACAKVPDSSLAFSVVHYHHTELLPAQQHIRETEGSRRREESDVER